MATARDSPLHSPVQFPAGSRLVRGHLARKSRSFALVVAEDGREYNVPWSLMQHRRSGERKSVSPRSEERVADFLPGAEVSFRSRSKTLLGVVIRNGPKRARIACNGTEYSVPYGSLRAVNAQAHESKHRRLSNCVAIAEALIQEHGLDGWSFQFDSAQKRAGACVVTTKVISLSRFYCIQAGDAQIRDTILHEIAHALAGPKHNHDATWKRIARSIGCTADRCHTVDFAPAKYIASCSRCGWGQKRNRRLRGGVCRTCGQLVTYRRFTQQAWDARSQQPS